MDSGMTTHERRIRVLEYQAKEDAREIRQLLDQLARVTTMLLMARQNAENAS